MDSDKPVRSSQVSLDLSDNCLIPVPKDGSGILYLYGAYLEADSSIFGMDYSVVVTGMGDIDDERSLAGLHCQAWSESGFLETVQVDQLQVLCWQPHPHTLS